jgi:hypothetical protein
MARVYKLVSLGAMCALPAWGRAEAPGGRYVVTADVVEDRRTGLFWHRAPVQNRSQANAAIFCADSELSGFHDWRLPTRPELETLLDLTRREPAIDPEVFPNTCPSDSASCNGYWTSSPYAKDSAAAWVVGFGDGGAAAGYTTNLQQARCVRSDS